MTFETFFFNETGDSSIQIPLTLVPTIPVAPFINMV